MAETDLKDGSKPAEAAFRLPPNRRSAGRERPPGSAPSAAIRPAVVPRTSLASGYHRGSDCGARGRSRSGRSAAHRSSIRPGAERRLGGLRTLFEVGARPLPAPLQAAVDRPSVPAAPAVLRQPGTGGRLGGGRGADGVARCLLGRRRLRPIDLMYMEDIDLAGSFERLAGRSGTSPASRWSMTSAAHGPEQADRWFTAFHRYVVRRRGARYARVASALAAVGLGMRAVS